MTDRLKIPMDKVIADYQRGMNATALAEKYGGCSRTIQRRLKRAGVWKAWKNPSKISYADDPIPSVDYEARCAELEDALNKLVSQVGEGHIYQPQDHILARVLQDKSGSEISTVIEINLRQHYLDEMVALRFKDLRRMDVGVGDALKIISEGYNLPVAKARRMVVNRLGNISNKYDIFRDEIVEAYQNGASTRELGYQWNTSTEVMRKQIRVWGVSDPNRLMNKRIRHKHIDQLPMQDIIADYKAGMPVVRICQKYYVSDRFLKKCLKQMGVPMRPPRSSNVGGDAPTPQPQQMPQQKLSDTLLSQVITDYKAGHGVRFLSNKYNLGRASIKRSLEQAGVALRKAGRPRKV